MQQCQSKNSPNSQIYELKLKIMQQWVPVIIFSYISKYEIGNAAQ